MRKLESAGDGVRLGARGTRCVCVRTLRFICLHVISNSSNNNIMMKKGMIIVIVGTNRIY